MRTICNSDRIWVTTGGADERIFLSRPNNSVEYTGDSFYYHSLSSIFSPCHLQVKEVTQVMTNNIEHVIARGEALSDLEERSEQLQNSSVQFRNNATKLRRKVLWKSIKLWVAVVVVMVLVLAIIAALIALGLTGKFKTKN